MRDLNWAWHVLSDPARRADWDATHPVGGSHWGTSRTAPRTLESGRERGGRRCRLVGRRRHGPMRRTRLGAASAFGCIGLLVIGGPAGRPRPDRRALLDGPGPGQRSGGPGSRRRAGRHSRSLRDRVRRRPPGSPHRPRCSGGSRAAIARMMRVRARPQRGPIEAIGAAPAGENTGPIRIVTFDRRGMRRRPAEDVLRAGHADRHDRHAGAHGQQRRAGASLAPACPSRLRVPSGKRPSAPPCSRAASAMRCAGRSPAPRRTKMTPASRASQPATGQLRISSLAMKWTMRPLRCPTAQPTVGGSRFEQWLATTSIGPVRGTCSSPSTRAGPTSHSSQLVTTAPGWKTQVPISPGPMRPLPRRSAARAGRCWMISSTDASTLSSPVSITSASCALRSGATAPLRVGGVALLDLVQVALESVLASHLGGAARGPDRGAGGQEDLERGVWQHHRADVAADHDRVPPARLAALQAEHGAAHRRMAADGAHRPIDPGRARLVGHVAPVEQHRLAPTLLVGTGPLDLDRHLLRQPAQRLAVIRRDASAPAPPGSAPDT